MSAFKISEKRDKLGRRRWRWNLVADNGEVIASSETYNSRASAEKGADAVKRLAAKAVFKAV